jgi:CheY-like chemotaxis protein
MLQILIVDDDPLQNKITQKIISNSGIEANVVSYTNPMKALRDIVEACATKCYVPDVILLDLQMPNLTGWQFMDNLSQVHNFNKLKTKVYIVSSSVPIPSSDNIIKYPFLSYLFPKPFSIPLCQFIVSENNLSKYIS